MVQGSRQEGFSLLTVMIISAVVTTLSIALIGLLQNMVRMSERSEKIQDIQSVMHQVEVIVANQNLCDLAIRNGNTRVAYKGKAVKFTDFKLDGQRFLKKGQKVVGHDNLKVNYMQLQPAAASSDITLGDGKTYIPYNVEVWFYFEDTNTSTVGGNYKYRSIELGILVGKSSKLIDYCFTPGSEKQICANMGGVMDANGNCANTYMQTADCSKACNGTKAPADPDMKPVTYISHFDADGNPVCECMYVLESTHAGGGLPKKKKKK